MPDAQELSDRWYVKHGPCCAGCDWWHQQAVAQAGPYTAPELRTWLRPGADDHERYPSRMGNVRLWRDGRREVAA